jgi:1-phosphofructokinase family hexose kinase
VLNAARAVHHLGGPGKALTVVGGTPGQAIGRDFAQLGIPARWVESATPTRVCTTILDASRRTATELVPESAELPSAERDAFLAAYAEEAATAAAVVLIGSLPPGTPADFYRDLLAHTSGKAVLDVRGPELLAALNARPFLVKPNREELERTLGRALGGDRDLFEAMEEINQRGAEWVLITDGGKPAHARGDGRLYRLRPLAQQVVNPIGCGDCMAAGIAWATAHGREPLDALRFGMAAAADKLGQVLPGVIDRGRVEALAASVEVVRL